MLRWALVVAVIVASIGGTGGYLYVRRSLPVLAGTLTLAGPRAPIEIIRDSGAVPHIYAGNQLDAYFGLGYVHAQDRLWQMEFQRRVGCGSLAQILGPAALVQDRYSRTLGVYRAPMLRHVLEYNGMHNVTIFDAQDVPLADLPGPYDFLYSFYAIGFHWSLEYFLDELVPLLHERLIAVFTVPTTFTPFAKLKTLPYRLIDWKTAWPSNGVLRLLVIGREGAPRTEN